MVATAPLQGSAPPPQAPQAPKPPGAENLFTSNPQASGILSTVAAQNTALGSQIAPDQAQQGITDTNLQQQYGDTLASLGIQQTQLGQQNVEQQGQYGIQQQENTLSGTGLQEALANLTQQYGFTQQGLGLQTTEAQQGFSQGTQNLREGSAGSGVLNSGTQRQGQANLQTSLNDALQSIGIQTGQAASNYQYGLQQNANSQKQLALTGQSEALSNTYAQQQYADALKQLGLSRTEAGQQLGTGEAQAANTLAGQVGGIYTQQQANTAGGQAQISDLATQLIQAYG